MTYKLGSLFDGSGGFPLSGVLCGVEPAWAAEVEPYPIAVTRSRFPKMKHLGDISKVSGADIEPVDIITFGSPCQDLSVAGKRAGLKHEANGDEETTRSGLFMEAVRIIKEMRSATNGEYPRFALWENVPGAFSSNKGEDFRIVCEELIKIVEPAAFMPSVPEKGWAYSDSYIGDGWSLAYRVFDAQYWGVPQRRRRIHLVVDFRGECAREILFEREGLRGYFAQGRTPWQVPAAYAQDCPGADDREGENTGGAGGRQLDAVGFQRQLSGVEAQPELSPTVLAAAGESGNNKPCVAYTLKVRSGCDVDSAGKAAGKGALVQTEKAATLACVQDQYLFQPTAYSFDSLAANSMKSSNPHSGCRETEVAKTLDTTDPNPSKNQGGIAIVESMAFTQNQRDELRDLGDKAGALQAQPGMKQQTFIIDNIGGQAEYGKASLVNGTLRSAAQGAVAFAVESHPQDSRVKMGDSVNQTLSSNMAHDAANGGLVLEAHRAESHLFENHSQDTRYKGPLDVAQTVSATYGMGGNNQPFVVEGKPTLASGGDVAGCLMASGYEKLGAQEMFSGDYTVIEQQPAVFDGANVTSPVNASNPQPGDPCHTLSTDSRNLLVEPVFCLQGNGIDRADTAGCNGKGVTEDVSYTLNTIDRPAVAYGLDRASYNQGQNALFGFSVEEEAQPTLTAMGPGAVCCTTGSYMQVTDEVSPTLMARDWKDPTCVSVNYIVRRLTPTECARLQGFADWHGHLEKKADLTDGEYSFWMEVRNTHAAINGKAVKEYTKAQMLTWYNKLWTDAAEYKMWGNGIALPPALYCMQGIMDVLNREEEDAWLL